MLAVILMCLLMSAAPALAYSYTTDSYDVNVKVNEDNTYQVTETISVNFAVEKHGIFRYIPVGNHKDMGYMSVKGIDVGDWNWTSFTENSNMVIQIGDEDETITGPAVYPVKYTVKIYDDRDPNRDFFYLDVIPTGWETPIEKASVKITLPKEIDSRDMSIYRGSYGSTIQEGVQWNYDEKNRVISIEAAELMQGEGVTVFCTLPEGYWQGEATYGWAKATAMVLVVIMPVVAILLWFFFGRDKKIVPTVEFYPPEGMSPAEIGYVIDSTVNQKDLVSLIFYYADKGYISIEQTGEKDFVLTKLKDIDDKEKNFVKTLFRGLFVDRDRVNLADLDEDFGDRYITAYQQLSEHFFKKKNRQTSVKSMVFQVLSLVFTIIACGAAIGLSAWYSAQVMPAVFAVVGLVALLVALLISIFRNKRLYAMKKGVKYVGGTILMVITAAAVLLYSAMLGKLLVSAWLVPCLFVLLMAACICIVNMRQRTKKSVDLMGKVVGLKNFIETAELDRINTLVEENPSYFYNILPYAYVMGLTDKWAKNFEGIATVQPSWYHSSYGRPDMFDIWMFSHVMNQCNRSFANNIHIPTGGDSGSGGGGFSGGGGGFSGGGFGGGGGGSW